MQDRQITEYLKINPNATPKEIAAVTNIPVSQIVVHLLRIVGGLTKPSLKQIEKQRLPTMFRPGAGDRNEDCKSYSSCLDEFSRKRLGDAHCPEACNFYQKTDTAKELLNAIAISRPGADYL